MSSGVKPAREDSPITVQTRVRITRNAFTGQKGYVVRDFGTSCEVALDDGLRVFKLKTRLEVTS